MLKLFTSYYNEKNPIRRQEIIQCLINNSQNDFINQIFVLIEPDAAIPFEHDKIIYVQSERPTFRTFFDLVNKNAGDWDVSIISNSDIFFDETIQHALKVRLLDCFAVSRWEINPDKTKGDLVQRRSDSQDFWLFKGKIKPIEFCDFPLGVLGTDNRIAYEIKQAGYNIYNPALTIKGWHLHNSNIRNYNPFERNEKTVIPPPYQMVHITDLNTIYK